MKNKAWHKGFNSRGFTLLEIVIAIGIVALLVVVLSQSFITTTRTNIKTNLMNTIKQDGDYAMETMSRLIRGAKGVPTGYTCRSTQETLRVTNLDDTTIEFGCDAPSGVARIYYQVDSNPKNYITGTNVTLRDFSSLATDCSGSPIQFTCTEYQDLRKHHTVKIKYQLSQMQNTAIPSDTASMTFESSVTMRNDTH